MVPFEENDNDIFMEIENASNEDLDVSPRIIGHEYQAEIPSVLVSFRMNPADSETVREESLFFAIDLEDSEHEELRYHGDSDSSQLEKSENPKLALGRSSSTWNDADTKSFTLGLFIFGKNFVQIKSFLENKGMGEILSFYYGMFYKTDGYPRWSECRKLKGRKCMIGRKLFTGPRQHELLSRLNPHVSKESQHTLLQVSKSYVKGRTSLEEYVSSLKSTVGLGVLVDAVGIGKENGDLTRFEGNKRALPAQTCKALSSLGPSDIIQSLTGGIRLSKNKSIELFWEAVWPRLLARGWHSEQPKNRGHVTSRDYLVFLIPGIDKFSRRKLVKGDHYFDSVCDVLSKVVAEPNILLLKEEEEEATKVGSCNEGEVEKGSNEDELSDGHRQCYLKPRSSTYNRDPIKLMVVDTSLVHGGKPSDLRELKSVPVNSVPRVEVEAAGKKYKGHKYMRKMKHNKDMSKSIEQRSTNLTAIDTNRFSEGKLLKLKVRLKYSPIESEDASTMPNGFLRESNQDSSTDYSSRIAEAKRLIYGKRKTNKTESLRGVSNNGATSKKEACDNLVNDANKMVQSQKNQQTCVFDDNPPKRVIKHQFIRKVRSHDSNHAAVPTKRRRLTACAKAEKSCVIENSSGGLGSEKPGFSRSSSFLEANKNVCEPVGLEQYGNSTASSADQSVEENNKKNILNESYQSPSVSCVEVEKCESFTYNIPQVLSNSENSKTMEMAEEGEQSLKAKDPCLTYATHEVLEESLRTPCNVDSLEQQADTNTRRQTIPTEQGSPEHVQTDTIIPEPTPNQQPTSPPLTENPIPIPPEITPPPPPSPIHPHSPSNTFIPNNTPHSPSEHNPDSTPNPTPIQNFDVGAQLLNFKTALVEWFEILKKVCLSSTNPAECKVIWTLFRDWINSESERLQQVCAEGAKQNYNETLAKTLADLPQNTAEEEESDPEVEEIDPSTARRILGSLTKLRKDQSKKTTKVATLLNSLMNRLPPPPPSS